MEKKANPEAANEQEDSWEEESAEESVEESVEEEWDVEPEQSPGQEQIEVQSRQDIRSGVPRQFSQISKGLGDDTLSILSKEFPLRQKASLLPPLPPKVDNSRIGDDTLS